MKKTLAAQRKTLTNACKRRNITLESVMSIKIPYNGKVIECDTPKEAIEVLKYIDSEQGKKITRQTRPSVMDAFVSQFGEAIELLAEDCILLGEGGDKKRFLYVGQPDDMGEYAVITLATDDGNWVGGFVPFDVWVAQQLGALEKEKHNGFVPQEYEAACKALADSNADGRVSFKSETRAVERDKESDDEDDEEESDDED